MAASSKLNMASQEIDYQGNLSIASSAVLTNSGAWVNTATGTISNPGSGNRLGALQASSGVVITATDHVYLSDFTYVGTGKLDMDANDKNLFLAGNVANSAASAGAGILGATATGKVEFDGSGAQSLDTEPGGLSLGRFRLNKSGGTLTQSSDCIITRMDLDAGTLDHGGFTIFNSGSWSRTSGTLTGTGTVDLTGTAAASISGATTWSTLKCTTNARTLTFEAGVTQTVATWNVQGNASNLISLVSSSPGTDWLLNVTGTQTTVRVSATDSDASAGIDIRARNSDDGGGNAGWVFVEASLGAVSVLVDSLKLYPPSLFSVATLIDENVPPVNGFPGLIYPSSKMKIYPAAYEKTGSLP